MHVIAQLDFDGNCREAFERYAQIFDGEIIVMNDFSDEDVPLAPGSSPAGPDLIRFAQVQIGDGSLLGNDLPAGEYRQLQGFNVAFHVDGADKARSVFDQLAVGGIVTTPLTEVVWAELFGKVRDRFGVPWLVLAFKDLASAYSANTG